MSTLTKPVQSTSTLSHFDVHIFTKPDVTLPHLSSFLVDHVHDARCHIDDDMAHRARSVSLPSTCYPVTLLPSLLCSVDTDTDVDADTNYLYLT